MATFPRGFRVIVVIAGVSLGSAGVASMTVPEPNQNHRSLLPARIRLANGVKRTVTLEGVGCPIGMCSRVAIRNMAATAMWLDGLASVTGIAASNSTGPVKVILRFKDGVERETLITAGNRILYLHHRIGFTEKLDLGSVREIDFTE